MGKPGSQVGRVAPTYAGKGEDILLQSELSAICGYLGAGDLHMKG